MRAALYGFGLQWKLDIRSKTLLITCYIVPLLFFALMGGIFSSISPDMKHTLIQSMTVMGVTMGAVIGIPPSIAETYGSDIKKVYKANGIPLSQGLISMAASAFTHLLIMCAIVFWAAPLAFGAAIPASAPAYFTSLAIFIAVSLGVGCVLGLLIPNQAKLTMAAQIIFLPSIMLSGIMFPIDLLPPILQDIGKIFPASWGFQLMLDNGLSFQNLWYFILVFIAAAACCGLVLKKQKSA